MVWKVKCNFILCSHPVMSPRCCQENCSPYLHFVFSWQHLLKSFPKASDKDPGWFLSCIFFPPSSVPPFSSFSITFNFYLHLLPHSTNSFSRTHSTQFRDRGLCVLETKAPLSLEGELSFRLKLTVSEGRGRADDGPRIRYVVKCVFMCGNLHLFIYLCFDSACY